MTGNLVGVYPGTFDPVTNGHMDIVTRAAKVVDHLIVAVAVSSEKGPLFSIDDRIAMLEEEIAAIPNGVPGRIEVRAFDNLLMHFVRQSGASVIVRGLRAVSDFEYEFQMAGMNARLDAEVETLFLMASERQQLIASRFVKEICRMGGNVSPFVSPRVKLRLEARFAEISKG